MATRQIEAESFKGISVLAASKIYKEIDASGSAVILYNGGQSAYASCVLDVLALGADKNSRIKVIAYGDNEDRIINNVSEILTDGAGI